MFSKLKMKLAAKKMQRRKEYAALDKQINQEETALERVILWPFRAIGHAIRWIYDTLCAVVSWIWDLLVAVCRTVWKWLCGINLIGLINLTLLLAILILFTLLITNFVRCHPKTVAAKGPAQKVAIESNRAVGAKISALPLRRNASNNNTIEPVNVVAAEPSKSPVLRAHGDGKIYGDIIIESRGEAIMLKRNAHIRGNLYLQHMRKYVLPCGVKIEGNLFLRDLNMLQFCGPFTVTGNIYVSPRSSFGPIPQNARVGGQIIL